MLYSVFKVRGSVGSYGGPERLVTIDEAGTDKPVMMQAYGDIMKYIDDVSSSDMEEKYMDKDFIYDGICQLVAILIPSTHEYRPAKAVILDRHDFTVKVFGEQGIIDTRKPEPMSIDDWNEAKTFALDHENFSLKVR